MMTAHLPLTEVLDLLESVYGPPPAPSVTDPWEQVLLDAYGIKPDAERTRYYRMLWEFG